MNLKYDFANSNLNWRLIAKLRSITAKLNDAELYNYKLLLGLAAHGLSSNDNVLACIIHELPKP
jgi:hypothetical protein